MQNSEAAQQAQNAFAADYFEEHSGQEKNKPLVSDQKDWTYYQDPFCDKIGGFVTPIYGLDACIKYGRSNRKYILMFDCTGQVETYF